MHTASPLPSTGEVFLDARGDGRALRVTRHAQSGLVVLSLWRDGSCVGTFRLPVEEVPDLVEVLLGGLREAYDDARSALLDHDSA